MTFCVNGLQLFAQVPPAQLGLHVPMHDSVPHVCAQLAAPHVSPQVGPPHVSLHVPASQEAAPRHDCPHSLVKPQSDVGPHSVAAAH